MKTVQAILLSVLFALPALAQQQPSEFDPKWVFQFDNGAEAYFEPGAGVHFKGAGEKKYRTRLSCALRGFESTEATPSFGAAREYFTNQGKDTYFMHAEPGAVTFFSTDEGVFAMNGNGSTTQIIAAPTDGRALSYEPLQPQTLANGKSFRGVALKIQQSEELYLIRLVGVSSELMQMSIQQVALPAQITGEEKYLLEIADEFSQRAAVRLKMQVNGNWAEEAALIKHWGHSEGFDLYRRTTTNTQFTSAFAKDVHYRALGSDASVATDSPAAEKTLRELRERSEQDRHTTRLRISADEVQPLVNLVNSQAYLGSVTGVVQYLRIRSQENAAIDRWIQESRTMSRLIQQQGLIIVSRRPDGSASVIYHPKGTGAELETTLTDCNLAF